MNILFKIKKQKILTTNRILNAALFWFGIGVMSVFVIATLFSFIPEMSHVAIEIFSNRSGWVTLSIFSISSVILIAFFWHKVNLHILILMFISYCVIEGFTLSIVFIRFIAYQETYRILLLFTIPAASISLMGFLGYKQIIDFSNSSKLLFGSLISLLVFGTGMYFTTSKIYVTLYSLLGYAIFSAYAGFDLWRISKTEQLLELNNIDNKEIITRYGIRFGLSLLIDFVQLVWFLARIFTTNY